MDCLRFVLIIIAWFSVTGVICIFAIMIFEKKMIYDDLSETVEELDKCKAPGYEYLTHYCLAMAQLGYDKKICSVWRKAMDNDQEREMKIATDFMYDAIKSSENGHIQIKEEKDGDTNEEESN